MRLFIANLIGLRSKSYLPRHTFINLPWTVYNSNSGEGKGEQNEGSSIGNRKIKFVFNL